MPLYRASWSFLLATLLPAQEPRPAKEILRDFDRVAMPSMSEGSDPESVQRFLRAIDAGCRRQGELAVELQRGHPQHRRLPALLATRWAGMTNALGEADATLTELEPLLRDDTLREDVRREALRALARARIASERCTNPERLDAVSDLFERGGKDSDFAASCLMDLVEERVADPESQRMLYELAVKRWPDNPYGGREAKRWLRLLERTGQPFVDQLPADLRSWFAEQTRDEVEYTVVQVWMGWVDADGDGKDREIDALQTLRREFGPRVRLLGLVNGDLEAHRAAFVAAGIDWPQVHLPDPEPMACPFGAPRVGFCFVLDRHLRITGFVGSARLLDERIRLLSEPSAEAVR